MKMNKKVAITAIATALLAAGVAYAAMPTTHLVVQDGTAFARAFLMQPNVEERFSFSAVNMSMGEVSAPNLGGYNMAFLEVDLAMASTNLCRQVFRIGLLGNPSGWFLAVPAVEATSERFGFCSGSVSLSTFSITGSEITIGVTAATSAANTPLIAKVRLFTGGSYSY